MEYLAARVGLEVPTRLRKVQYNGMTETFTAALESEEVDTGATIRIEVVMVWMTILEPGGGEAMSQRTELEA